MTSAASSAAVSGVETRLATRDGAMLFDARLGTVANDDWFEPGRWPSSATAAQVAGGRGGVIFLRDGERRWVLRHYRRGGAVATLLGDRYLWTGEDRTRAFREWRLLRQLEAWALPVPRAIAARYRRAAFCYRADLITGETTVKERQRLYDAFRRGEITQLVVSKVANFSIDLPEASVAIQISGTFGSRQEEAQRLGRVLRPKGDGRTAHFYTVVSRDTVDADFAAHRQRFLAEQGYSYRIVDAADLD